MRVTFLFQKGGWKYNTFVIGGCSGREMLGARQKHLLAETLRPGRGWAQGLSGGGAAWPSEAAPGRRAQVSELVGAVLGQRGDRSSSGSLISDKPAGIKAV